MLLLCAIRNAAGREFNTALYCAVMLPETHKTNSNPKPTTVLKFGSADQLSSVISKMWM